MKLRGDIDAQLRSAPADLAEATRTIGSRSESHEQRLAGRKVAPLNISQCDPKLQWAGRGAVPTWMREEMKTGSFKKEAFVIK